MARPIHGRPRLVHADAFLGSAEARDREESAFYGSDEWRDGPREPILALIETYHTIVLPAPSSTIDGLRRIASSAGKAR